MIRSIQVPLFWQGWNAHSSMSEMVNVHGIYTVKHDKHSERQTGFNIFTDEYRIHESAYCDDNLFHWILPHSHIGSHWQGLYICRSFGKDLVGIHLCLYVQYRSDQTLHKSSSKLNPKFNIEFTRGQLFKSCVCSGFLWVNSWFGFFWFMQVCFLC